MAWQILCLCNCSLCDIFMELQNPPFKLSIDYSCSDGIEEGGDGIWNIVGGKVNKDAVMP
jgi:hypothetical protein